MQQMAQTRSANALQFSEKKDFVFILSEMQISGDLFPRDNFGDFFPTHSSLNSMSLESEQLQLSVYEIMGFTHTSSGKKRAAQNKKGEFELRPPADMAVVYPSRQNIIKAHDCFVET